MTPSTINAHSVDDVRGGISGGNPQLYSGKVDYFDYRVEGKKHPNPLEWTGKNYQIYFPTLFLEYNKLLASWLGRL